jgi:hypothetical protein
MINLHFKDSESPVLGKERSKFLIEGFRRKCKEKFGAGKLSSTGLEIGKLILLLLYMYTY